MSTLALCLMVVVSVALLGAAAWTWWALVSVSELQIEFGRFEAEHFKIK